jgi:hypothetical protein
MTLPYERTNAVIYTEKFLLDLIDPKKTPRVPSQVRDRARSLLRHYPTEYEIETVAEQSDMVSDPMRIKIFGRKLS